MSTGLEVQRATESAATPDDEQFKRWARAAIAHTGKYYSLVIRVVDEEEGLRFNRQYRNKNTASNVLSFPFELPDGLAVATDQPLPGDLLLGDLLVCAPVVEREALEQGKPVLNHWAHLTVHGILHLLGHDHVESDAALEMETLETEILAGLKIPDPYQGNL